jgi:hypothetical protein
MEFAIPISRFDPTRVRWCEPRVGPFRKTIPFGYTENQLIFNNLILVLQPLRIVELDWSRNQVILEESNKMPFLSKLEQFQTIVGNELEKQSKNWIDNSKSIPLQPWLKSKKLTLYLSSQPDMLPFFTEDGAAVFSEKTIKPGDIIRAVVKIQGLFLNSLNYFVASAATGTNTPFASKVISFLGSLIASISAFVAPPSSA